MFYNPYGPYWWLPNPLLQRNFQPNIRRVDVNGIYELCASEVQLTDASVDYGINPCRYNELPCESIVLLKIYADVPAGGEGLPVTVVTPNGGQTTLSPSGATSGTKKVPVVDSNNNPVRGADVTGTTERLAYINKATGVIRFLEFTAGTTPAPTGGNTPAAASEQSALKSK